MMRVSVVGGGVGGLVSAYVVAKAGAQVVVYDKHAQTATYDYDALHFDLLCNHAATQASMIDLYESLGIEMEESDMSFSVSVQGYEWGTRNGLSSLFAQNKNAFNPYFWTMIREIVTFKQDVLSYLEMIENNRGIDCTETIGQFINSKGYSDLFQKAYLVPVCCSIWCCSLERLMSFSAFSVLSFCRTHHLLELFGKAQRLSVKKRSHSFVSKMREELERRGCEMRIGCEVQSVTTTDEGDSAGCTVLCGDGSEDKYDGCIMAVDAPEAMKMLGKQATCDEIRVLGAFQYVYSDVYLHRDKSLMPAKAVAWSTWNFLSTTDDKVCCSYCPNMFQNFEEDDSSFIVTLNPYHKPENALVKWTTGRPVPSVAATKACFELGSIQGRRGIWFCQGLDFHEDGLKGGMNAANNMLGKCCDVLSNPKHMIPSWMETGARHFVTRFFRNFISTGCLILLEEGGTVFRFEGSIKKCSHKALLKIHTPQFYWKVMTQADLGLADAYVNGDFSFVDENEGLLSFFLILIANKDLDSSSSKWKKRGWWRPMLLTAALSSAKYFFKHVARQNTLTQARRNISRHYDLSNDLFALFLDETMTYSCAVFKSENEDLKVAQMRKLSSLIDKARIEKEHEVLDIGCGWGGLAIEIVKRSGCKYTGITLSEEQLKFAEMRVKQAGLQDNIKFLLRDYRKMPDTYKYDRIISCGMIEHIGHEYVDTFFSCCESLLAEDGLFVLQFISMPEPYYDEYMQSSGFIKEYIFPGGSLPSLSRITSGMAASSNFCVEHVENIGIHYYQTLRCWRKKFLENRSKIVDLGFDDKFIRTWEYYFDYCASGFKSRILGDYQMVFSRPGNVGAFADPYKGFPPAY